MTTVSVMLQIKLHMLRVIWRMLIFWKKQVLWQVPSKMQTVDRFGTATQAWYFMVPGVYLLHSDGLLNPLTYPVCPAFGERQFAYLPLTMG